MCIGEGMTSKELAEEIKAEEYLESKGYKKFPCENCKGVGSTTITSDESGIRSWTCMYCDGRGWKWICTVGK